MGKTQNYIGFNPNSERIRVFFFKIQNRITLLWKLGYTHSTQRNYKISESEIHHSIEKQHAKWDKYKSNDGIF